MLTVGEVRSLVNTPLSDLDLQRVIDWEEAWLARRIGPLDGERTQTFTNPERTSALVLQRPTTSVAVTDDATSVTDVALRSSGWLVERTDYIDWAGPVAVTYTPSDSDEVTRVIIELVRLAIADLGTTANTPGYQSETIGDYSYTRAEGAQSPRAARKALLWSLQRPRQPSTLRILSSYPLVRS